MNLGNTGQKTEVWNQFWNGLTPASEIQKWDFYGLREWITKFAPREGKVIEAGCGLGRYVFYLAKMGIDIDGIDFEQATINFLNNWKLKNNLVGNFQTADVTKLPYNDSSLSGYISLGVIEHFIEGPQRPLSEAYRVLRPGGVAIITTPSKSFSYYLQRIITEKTKSFVKKITNKNYKPRPFFQYFYSKNQLKKFVEKEGFRVTKYKGCALIYSFFELGNNTGKNIRKKSFAVWFSNKFERTIFSNIGASSVVIAVKKAEKMHCFICGDYSATQNSLNTYDVPICQKCSCEDSADYYLKNKTPKMNFPYLISPPILQVERRKCDYCSKDYYTHSIFEDYGFTKNCCEDCLKISKVNIELTSEHIKPVWRMRSNIQR